MRVFIRSNGALSPARPLSLSSQTFCETEDILGIMKEYVAANGLVDKLYIEFEGMRIPICHEGELRVVAQLAAAYNNAIIEQNLRCQKDLHGESYRPIPDKHGSVESESPPLLASHATDESCAEDVWDEELHGERVVYDESYEQNAEISPWMVFKSTRSRKFGEFDP